MAAALSNPPLHPWSRGSGRLGFCVSRAAPVGGKGRVVRLVIMAGLLVTVLSAVTNAQHLALVRFSGEVRSGEMFEKPVATGVLFRLSPSQDPSTPGWRIEVYREQSIRPERELSWVATPPYRGWNPRYVEVSYGHDAKEVAATSPRNFSFVLTLLDQFKASAMVRKVLWPGGASAEQLKGVQRDLDSIPRGNGSLAILNFKLTGEEGEKAGHIEWLRFQVELSVPMLTPRPTISPRTIRDAAFEDALTEVFLADSKIQDECPEDRQLVEVGTRVFGDLDGDGKEEAAVTGYSCFSGTGGSDVLGVFKLLQSGELRSLPLSPRKGQFHGSDPYEGIRGHMGLEIESGKLVLVFPVYRPEDPNCCPSGGERRLVFKWDGKGFVLVDVVVVPEGPK